MSAWGGLIHNFMSFFFAHTLARGSSQLPERFAKHLGIVA